MQWNITLVRLSDERYYQKNTRTRYRAVIEALEEFLLELKIEGKPYQFMSGNDRYGEVEITTRCDEDDRLGVYTRDE